MVVHSSCLLPVIQSFDLVVGCLLAWDNHGNVLVGFTFDFSSFLIRYWMTDLDAIYTNDRFLRTTFPAKILRVILSIIELERTCPNHRRILLRLQSYEWFHLQS